MAKTKVSYTELVHQVVQGSVEPLTVVEIMDRVNDITSITTKNPKNTIRNAIGQSKLIAAIGDGRYGWMPRLVTGSILRLTLTEADLAGTDLEFTDEVRNALWPAFFEIQKRRDITPVQLKLPGGSVVEIPLEFQGLGRWGTSASPEFWDWLNSQNPTPGDHLLIEVLDGEAKLHTITFQARADRDEPAISARNEAIINAAFNFMNNRYYGTATWDLTAFLLATGQYRHPIPPDSLPELVPDLWAEDKRLSDFLSGIDTELFPQPEATIEADPTLSALFGAAVQVYDYENPPDLPREYDPDYGQRRPRASQKAKKGPVKTFTFRVNHRALPKVWRDIELAEDQTLEDLHLIVQQAYDWWDDHLYSFFMSGQGWDQASEIGCPWTDASLHTHQVEIGQLKLEPGQKFLYLFDYGDNHEFDVTLLAVNPSAGPDNYPKIVARKGRSPEQYPDYDDE